MANVLARFVIIALLIAFCNAAKQGSLAKTHSVSPAPSPHTVSSELSPSPDNGVDAPSSSPVESPSESPENSPSSSPSESPTESPTDSLSFSPESAPSPSPTAESSSIVPVPAPDLASEAEDSKVGDDAESFSPSSKGMSTGKKAGVVVGLMFGVALAGLVFVIYRKRQENIRRAQYGFATRRDLL